MPGAYLANQPTAVRVGTGSPYGNTPQDLHDRHKFELSTCVSVSSITLAKPGDKDTRGLDQAHRAGIPELLSHCVHRGSTYRYNLDWLYQSPMYPSKFWGCTRVRT